MNDPLNRAKTEGMPNPKNMPSLMCPASATAPVGGPPHGSGDAGGHIKEGTWAHAGDAATAGLRHTDGADGNLHGSGPGGGLRCYIGSCGFCSAGSTVDTDQLGPDQVPVFGTEVPSADSTVRLSVDGHAQLWAGLSATLPGRELVKVNMRDSESLSDSSGAAARQRVEVSS